MIILEVFLIIIKYNKHFDLIFYLDESYYNKLKVDELKGELKKKNINFPKNARKNELIELLVKNITG